MEDIQSEEDLEELEDQGSFKGFSTDEEHDQVDGGMMEGPTAYGDKAKVRQRGKKSPPTQEELMELMFRSSSFQSNHFKLQIDELLGEVRVKYDKMEKVEQVLHQLKDILSQLPESEEQLVLFLSIRCG
jgi:U3 small nucleolar RNA-associated protein 22